ncbi:MAG: phage terminase large subunit [Alphaproteobacteria bacterium]
MARALRLAHELEAARLRQDFSYFLRRAFATVDPSTAYLSNWHIALIGEHLKACAAGEITRLIVNVPPRSLKSITVSVAWPAWLLGRDPTRRIVAASYSLPLALKHSLDCRLVLGADWYRRAFPALRLARDQNEKAKFVTTARGFRYATSVGGTLTGEGGDILIIDDPHDPRRAASEVERARALAWFDQTFSTRLNDKRKGAIVVVMQRLHEDDLTGHLLKKGGWHHLCLPAIAEAREEHAFGAVHKVREAGELLHPAREGEAEIARAKHELGSYGFAAQYQQRPAPLGGGLVKLGWFRRYRARPAAPRLVVQSWDTAHKAGADNDHSVCGTFAETEGGFALVELFRARLEFPDLKRAALSLAVRDRPHAILIEDKASGQSLIQALRRETTLPVVPVRPVGDKLTRMAAASAAIEAGRILLPEAAPWLADYELELSLFPNAAHDDQADMTSQFIAWMLARGPDVPRVRVL